MSHAKQLRIAYLAGLFDGEGCNTYQTVFGNIEKGKIDL